MFGFSRRSRQLIKLHIVEHKTQVDRIMRVINLLVSLVTITAIICYHGFYIDYTAKEIIHWIIVGSLLFYVFKYYFFLLYSLHPWRYIRESWLEFIIIQLLVIYFFLNYILGFSFLENSNNKDYYLLFIQFYFLIIAVVEVAKASTLLSRLNINPPMFMMMSFFILLSMGTLLLMLPRMTIDGISFIDALFTATSASCVTGLNVIPISSFTLKGQVIIMILIQLGGISILSFATFFSIFLTRAHISLRQQHLVKDLLSTNRVSDSYTLLREIIISTFVIEFMGALLLFLYWNTTGSFETNGQNIFYACFHAISAFNNAGFALWDQNFMDHAVIDCYFVQTIIMLLVFLGSIGFVALSDFFNPRFIRERKKFRWKGLLIGTKIVLITTFSIIVVATILIFAIEYNNTLAIKGNFFEKAFAALFQVISGRTAGFNIVHVYNFGSPTLLVIMVIMFIGAAPGSTGGGIKVTTFFVLIKSVFATIRGKKYIEFQRKMIPFELVDKSYSIVFMSLLLIIVSTFCLSLMEPDFNFSHLLFETISAFSTCGLSTGDCAAFGEGGKAILVLNMYIGRIGTLTLAFALSRRVKEGKHQYPETYFMVG